MKALAAVATSKPFLLAILIAWAEMVITSYWTDPNNVTGTIMSGVDWVIKLVMFGGAESLPLVYLTLLFMFPMFFIFIPAIILLKIRNKRGAQNANA